MTAGPAAMRPRNFQDILARLPDARQGGDGWTASCPAPGHKTPKDHLSLKDAGDKALATCQGGKHGYQDLCLALGFDSLSYSADGVGGDTTIGKPCPPVHPFPKQIRNRVDTPVDVGGQGVNLAALAEAKRLPVDFLKSLGLSDFRYNGQPSVRIPYYSADGQEVAVRFRLALSGDDRFRWRRGDRASPYGLHRLAQIRAAGWVLVVEGESDCWTAWQHGIPALGAPGKGVWPSSWAGYLQDLQVYVWQEPDAEDFVLRLLASAPGLRYVRAPDGIKDVSEAHIRGLDTPIWLEDLKAKAESGQALKARYDNKRLVQAYNEAKSVIEAPDPLALVKEAIRALGYGGDLNPAIITYLAATSRLLEMRPGAMPVHLLLTGPSSGGKSYTLGIVCDLLPPEAYHEIDAGSPRTIIYDDADLRHRVLIFGEADSLPAGEDNPAASAVRNLLQDHSLHYEVTVRDTESGDYTVRRIEKPGPTVLITTSTRSLGAQLMTRLFSLELGDSKEQIGAALEMQATLETSSSQPPPRALVAFQHYLQLRAPLKVVVPFAGRLAQAMGNMASAPRILRDFARLLSLVKSVTIIRHHWRQTDNEGRLVSTLADYGTVRALVAEMYVSSTSGATSPVREVVGMVRELDASRADGERVTNSLLARRLEMSVKQAERRGKRAIKLGWLVNREQRKSYPADYAPGEPMPEAEGLPVLEEPTPLTPVDTPLSTVPEAENGRVDRWTPLTDSAIPPLPPAPEGVTPCSVPGCGEGVYIFADGGTPYCEKHAPPEQPCPVCESSEWWHTPWGAWLCGRCHPQPSIVRR